MTTIIRGLRNLSVEPIEILLADDNPADARLTAEGFKVAGLKHKITVVQDGQQVLDYLRRKLPYAHVSLPDLILLDLNMPKKNGHEVLSEVKSDNDLKMIPIIVFTASDAERDINESYRLQANAYITKPIDLDEFIRLVRSIDEFWFKFVKLPKAVSNGISE